jgi:DNA-binding transcriptional ArsR family regulator
MPLLPQDLYVVLQLAVVGAEEPTTYAGLASRLHLSPSRVHEAMKRARIAGLVDAKRRVLRSALLEFLVHGVRYAFFAERGPITRGVPTAHAAPPLAALIADGGPVPVWPDPQGAVRGETITPLHPAAPRAAQEQPQLYELLALVDALRIGRARERKLAATLLEERLPP